MALPHDSSRRDQPDTQWLERMFNNRLRVPDYADYFARWADESAAARRRIGGAIDVAYGPAPRERLDAFAAPSSGRGPGRGGAPLVVFVHGGYWRALDKSLHSFVAGALHDLGAACVVPNYSLCPATTITDITLQVLAAVRWAWRHAGELGADARRISVIGHSAGGHLAAMALACAWPVFDAALPPDVVRRGIGISGLYELEPLMDTPSLQESLRLTPAGVAAASPARLPPPAQGRFDVVVGSEESAEYVRQMRLLQGAWGRERVPVAAALPGLNHFSVLDALVAPGTRLHALARAMCRA